MQLSAFQRYQLGKLSAMIVAFVLFLQLQGLILEGFGAVVLFNILADGLLVGTALAIFELYLFPKLPVAYPQVAVALIKTLTYLAIVLGGMLLLIYLLPVLYRLAGMRVYEGLSGVELLRGNLPMFSRIIAINLLGCFVIAFFNRISRLLGNHRLMRYLNGQYRQPAEEERIFMFLDIKSSTTIAEQLGNFRYSRLLSDFFSDLTEPVLESSGEIYQYVGDEAVITWPMALGIRHADCLQCFYRMEEKIGSRRAYYLHTYGLVPQFKAGLHCGKVITTQVGDLKSEIVYHGDVLNTAARIQEACNRYGYPLLLSDTLAGRLTTSGGFLFRYLDQVQLRGKETLIGLVAVLTGQSSLQAT